METIEIDDDEITKNDILKPTPVSKFPNMIQKSFIGKIPNVYIKAIPEKNLEGDCYRYFPMQNCVTTIEEAKKISKQEYNRVQPKSDAWFWLRSSDGIKHGEKNGNATKFHRYGASDIGALLGLHTTYAKTFFKGKRTVGTNLWGKEKWMKAREREISRKNGDGNEPTNKEEVSAPTQTNFDWGTNHEPNVIRYVLEKLDTIIITGCGSFIYESQNDSPFDIYVTPDGLWKCMKTGLEGTFEAKTKCPFKWNAKKGYYFYAKQLPFEQCPEQYYGQANYQAMVTNNKFLIIACWTLTGGTTMMFMKRDDLFIKLSDEALKWAHKRYVVDGVDFPDTENPYADWPHYDHLLEVIKRGCASKLNRERLHIDNLDSIEPELGHQFFLDSPPLVDETRGDSLARNCPIETSEQIQDQFEKDQVISFRDKRNNAKLRQAAKKMKPSKKSKRRFVEIHDPFEKYQKFYDDDESCIVVVWEDMVVNQFQNKEKTQIEHNKPQFTGGDVCVVEPIDGQTSEIEFPYSFVSEDRIISLF